MPKLVAITGATGFIGQVLLHKLVENGWSVRALTRQPRSDRESVQWIHGDLGNRAALSELVEGISAVVHCAGAVRGSTLKEFVRTNVEGTKNLLNALTEQKHKARFLLISSLAARQPELSWYAESKFMAEQLIAEYDITLSWAAFRPSAVYGPGDRELKPLFQAIQRGILPVVGNITNRFGLLHVEDLVTAIFEWLSTDVPIPGTFELDDGTSGGYSYQSLAAIAQQVWGRPVHCIAVPYFFSKLIAISNLRLARLLHYAPMLTPGKVNELQHQNWVCDNTPLIHALPSWQPRIRLHDFLSQVV